MDQSITLRHKGTAQECAFADAEQADHFGAHIDHPEDWEVIGGNSPASVKPAGTVIEVDLGEPRASVAADTAAQAAEPAPAAPKARRKHK